MVMPTNSFNSGYSSMSSGNVYQNLHSKYGCGYIDYAERPKVHGYPLGINPSGKHSYFKGSWLGELIKNLYS